MVNDQREPVGDGRTGLASQGGVAYVGRRRIIPAGEEEVTELARLQMSPPRRRLPFHALHVEPGLGAHPGGRRDRAVERRLPRARSERPSGTRPRCGREPAGAPLSARLGSHRADGGLHLEGAPIGRERAISCAPSPHIGLALMPSGNSPRVTVQGFTSAEARRHVDDDGERRSLP
jgi:hypothetical protein